MNKDVIYIDIEDDITSIIERVKSSPEKIVALVPPKGSSVLQSIVNLKLLKRATDSVDKKSVIVTSNSALQNLSGGVGLYVAKNLQSKPVLMNGDEAEALVDGDDVEVTDNLPEAPAELDDETEDVELSDEELASLESEDGTGSVPLKDNAKKKSKKNKVPNFDSFRKKLLIGAGVGLLLIIVLLLVFGRSKASVVVRAETTPVDVQFDMTVDTAFAQSNPDTAQVRATPKEQKKTVSQSFTPTGKKDLGTKASGTLTLKNCSSTDGSVTIPAGTVASASGLNFVTQSAVSLPASVFSGGGTCLTSTKTVDVSSQENGDKYNLGSRSYSVAGFNKVDATGSNMSGGTSRIVTVVSQDDINKASEQLKQQDSTGVKSELVKTFNDGTRVLDDTFTVSVGTVTSAPGLNAEGNEASLSAEVTYSILGIKSDDLSNAMNLNVVSQMSNPDQQSVFDNGYKEAKLEKKSGNATNAVYTVTSVAQYGPQFDTSELAEQITGTKVGEARSTLQSLPGVKSVDINLSPFWSSKLPGTSRIDIKLDVDKTVSG
jgi:hypothetical protein